MTQNNTISISEAEAMLLIESHRTRIKELSDQLPYAAGGSTGSSSREDFIDDQIRNIEAEIERLKAFINK